MIDGRLGGIRESLEGQNMGLAKALGQIYATTDERVTLICDWPEGKQRPVIAASYAVMLACSCCNREYIAGTC